MSKLGSFIQENISLKDKNWFKTGGDAKFYCEPKNPEEFSEALEFANKNNIQLFVLGEGANILISDEGFDGLIIRPQLKEISKKIINEAEVEITSQSGMAFGNLINWCLDNSIIGLEEFSGIPGTVGGSVYINIHYYEFLLSDFLLSAQVIEKKTGKIFEVDNKWFNFGYNQSTLLNQDYFLISATFKLKKVNEDLKQYAKGRSFEIIRHRNRRYPTQATCGSFFRNFYESEVQLNSQNKKIIYVAYYLDKIGVKGSLSVGDAKVSYQHANMLINQGTANSSDLINLALKMQNLVKDNFNIIPQPECRLLGFKKYPLLEI